MTHDNMPFSTETMDYFFTKLRNCEGILQREDYHPERCVLNHSLQVFKISLRETNDIDLLLAALLHDIGKAESVLSHDKIAVSWLQDYCSVKTLWLIENHLRIWLLLTGQMKKAAKVDSLVTHCWLPELILLARWDKSGRNPRVKMSLDEQWILDSLSRKIDQRFNVEVTHVQSNA